MERDYQNELRELVEGFDRWFEEPAKCAASRMSMKLYPYTQLFSPITVNRCKIKNRIVMGPMGNINMADETGRPSAKMIAYFTERARGGTGLITTGLIPVNFEVDPSIEDLDHTSVFPRLEKHRSAWAGWRDLASAVHAHGSKIFIQLTPGVGRVGSPECLLKKRKLPISSSWNPNFYVPQIPCRPISDRKCRRLIRDTGQAAVDSKELGIDGIYLHGHEGYLLEQMANSAFNRRIFGQFRDKQAFGIEMVKEIRKRCGPDYPLMFRINLSLAFRETYGDRLKTIRSMRKFQNERTVAETLEYMTNLVKAGVDIFDVDLGGYDNWWLPHPPTGMPAGCYLPAAKTAKDYFRNNKITTNKGQEVPVVAVGKLGYPDLAERALRDGLCDMIMLARPLLADPHWPVKAMAGRVDEIIPCIGDQEGCFHEFIRGGHPQCSVNPRTGFEEKYPISVIEAATRRPKKIAVVGAGPAGVAAACAAASRGHNVTLFDKNKKPGGALIPGSSPKTKIDLANYMEYLGRETGRHAKSSGLKLKFGVSVTAKSLKAMKFDVVITCTGSASAAPSIEGIYGKNVVTGTDFLNKPGIAAGSNNVVIIGGGSVGCEIALMLRSEMGKNVTVIEQLPHFMETAFTANRMHVIYSLYKSGAILLNCVRVTRILPDSVSIVRMSSKNMPDPYATWTPLMPKNIPNPFERKLTGTEESLSIRADLVVIAAGFVPDDSLYESCVKIMAAKEIYNCGDSSEVAKILEATRAGFEIGISV
jgi:2-enoate reductase